MPMMNLRDKNHFHLRPFYLIRCKILKESFPTEHLTVHFDLTYTTVYLVFSDPEPR